MAATYHLAQMNVARGREPLDSPAMADFVALIPEINALAESSPGFVWRLRDDAGVYSQLGGDPSMLVNISVWESLEALRGFVYRSRHSGIMRRREEWFEPLEGPHMVLWWIAAGQVPGVEDCAARLKYLALHGPTLYAFDFKSSFPAPTEEEARAAAISL